MNEHHAGDASDGDPGDDPRTGVESTADQPAGDQTAGDLEAESALAGRLRQRRRATTPPPPGSDPSPVREPQRHRLDENDARLTAEKPPHY